MSGNRPPVRIGSVELGAGRPKVCVPLTGATLRELQAEARAIRPHVADLVELRIDRFADVAQHAAVEEAIGAVRAALDDALPILLTCRSEREGGGADLAPVALEALIGLAARHPAVAAVDVEMEAPGAAVLIGIAHSEDKPVVVSFHDFHATPSREEIVLRLARQEELGADVVKLACMPTTAEDVLTLLGATADHAARPDARPAITMAMGPLGVVSRLAGETFGSVLTFGSVGSASAPGQVEAPALRAALDLLHRAQQAGLSLS